MLKFEGVAHRAAQFFEKTQLTDRVLWKKFSDQFRLRPDGEDKGWRGEFWGKMMRGGSLICEYTGSEELYRILTDAVLDVMTAADPDGAVSSYGRDCEFTGWDMWNRKYVMLGCEYYLEICRDGALARRITDFLRRQADCIIARVGDGEGKIPITRTSQNWLGINSSSVLEPVARLYRLTGDGKYLDFAAYIVESGAAEGVDVFEAAYRNETAPYRYGVSKAYELISCFEGLLEYYLATGIEKYRVAVVNFARAMLRTEVSVIGGCGVTGELLDHTSARQTVSSDEVSHETCVTVTWMKFCSRVLELTGDSVFADAMEKAFYNAYLGALNVYRRDCPFPDEGKKATYLPVDSYSPLLPGRRGRMIAGFQLLPDMTYYGCCACISAAGAGVFLRSAVVAEGDRVTVNFFEQGQAEFYMNGVRVTLEIRTAYPADGDVALRVRADSPVRFALRVRDPGWADGAGGYATWEKEWSDDRIGLRFDMPIKILRPEHWDTDVVYTKSARTDWGCYYCTPAEVTHKPEEDRYFAVTRGPVTLAADGRTGKAADSAFEPCFDAVRRENEIEPGVPCLEKFEFRTRSGENYCLVDYSSAGRDWETDIAAWLPAADGDF
ncbi:MAG: glycoside hydrolase family 127 protein [Clostridia bacterium]|nr:glycoside hydrolase family 127 protein [Clostridia bacterium]